MRLERGLTGVVEPVAGPESDTLAPAAICPATSVASCFSSSDRAPRSGSSVCGDLLIERVQQRLDLRLHLVGASHRISLDAVHERFGDGDGARERLRLRSDGACAESCMSDVFVTACAESWLERHEAV